MSRLTLTAEPGSHELVMTRDFAAPRERVFAAFTDPALLAQWWGWEGATTVVDALDARKGGVWRYVQQAPGGVEYAFNGVFHEVTAPERLVYTFEFETMPGHVLLETLTFEERPDGGTRMIDASVFQSVADRDGMLATGMEAGAAASLDRLEALLARMQGGEAGAASARAADLAARIEALNEALAATIAGCSDEEWRRTCVGEGWPIGVVAHHFVEVEGFFAGVLARQADDPTPQPIATDAVDENNARHARERAGVTQAETLEEMRTNGGALIRQVRGLDDARLDAVGAVVDGQELSVAMLVELGVIGHGQEHLGSIRAALAEPVAQPV